MGRRRKKKDDGHENLERWLLTYADLITLLLAFFIVMYSMSRIDAKRFGKMAEALSGVLKGGDTVFEYLREDQTRKGHGLLNLGDLDMLKKQIEDRFEKIDQQDVVHTEITERGLVVHIMESALFKEGSANIEPKAFEVLDIIHERVARLPNHIRIEGHTDDVGISSFHEAGSRLSCKKTEVGQHVVKSVPFPSLCEVIGQLTQCTRIVARPGPVARRIGQMEKVPGGGAVSPFARALLSKVPCLDRCEKLSMLEVQQLPPFHQVRA